LDIDLTSLDAAGLTAVKDALLEVAAAAGGFDAADVESIELVQDGKVIDLARQRRANGPITARVIIKADATVDLKAATARMNKAIEAGTVTVTFAIAGVTFTANVTKLTTLVAAVTTGSGSGSVVEELTSGGNDESSAASFTGVATSFAAIVVMMM
jgi:hypothetical protein